MREEVFQKHKYAVGYRIDKQLLLGLEDIFSQYKEKYILGIGVECTNNTRYRFDSINECFEYFEKKPYRIVKMEIVVTYGEIYDGNEITMTFDNSYYACTEIRFRFNNGDDYLLLKNKIELCLKNFRLNYRILSTIPIMPTVFTILFITLCVYTSNNNIVFPMVVQCLIIYIWLGGSYIFAVLPPFVRIKRKIFPCVEFRVGQNELIEEKNSKIRSFIVGTVVIGIIIGIMVNYISGFLF